MPNHDQIAIVTGGASGIGRALSEELGHRGATIVVADIQLAGAERVAAEITSRGGNASAARVDVRQSADVQALVDNTVTRYGQFDYMFNNAGIGVGGEIRELTLEHWSAAIDVNLMGCRLRDRHWLPWGADEVADALHRGNPVHDDGLEIGRRTQTSAGTQGQHRAPLQTAAARCQATTSLGERAGSITAR